MAKNVQDAKKAFQYGDKPGQISAEVHTHEDASALREAKKLSGKVHQSMHVAPSSFMKFVLDYVRDKATAMLGERGKHISFDKVWKDWAKDQRRLGRKRVSVQELQNAMVKAILDSPFKEQQGALLTLLYEELYDKFKLDPMGEIDLPYRTIPPLKPGPELDALKAKYGIQ
jgi:hypothetical protein